MSNMYKSVVIEQNTEYPGPKQPQIPQVPKVILKNSSVAHITVTAVEPKKNLSIEVMIRKDELLAFIKDISLV